MSCSDALYRGRDHHALRDLDQKLGDGAHALRSGSTVANVGYWKPARESLPALIKRAGAISTRRRRGRPGGVASDEPHGVGVMFRMIVSSDRFRTQTSSCVRPRSRRSSNS